MKVIQINTEVTLESKVVVNSGAIAVPLEVYYNVNGKEMIGGTEKIPAQIFAPIFESVTAYQEKKPNVGKVLDYSNTTNDYVIQKYYTTDSAEKLAIDVIYAKLFVLFPNQIEIIEI